MASIIVRYKKSNKYKLWNTVVDMWVSPLLPREQMIAFLLESEEVSTRKAAEDWVDRKNHSKEHIERLERFYDNATHSLNRLSREHARDNSKPVQTYR